MSELIDPRQHGPDDAGFGEIVRLIGASRERAMQAVNTVLIDLYWQIGEIISRRVATAQGGEGAVDQLASYIGAAVRKLMMRDVYQAPNLNFTGEFVLSNSGTSGYNALQAQYRHRLSHGVQTLLSYTWGHSIDDVSSDGEFLNVPPVRHQSRVSAVRLTTTYGTRFPLRFLSIFLGRLVVR